MKRILVPALLAAVCGLVVAKLPPPDAVTKAKADETAAKNAWQGKVDAWQLCKVQDKIAAGYAKTSGKPVPAAAKAASASASGPGVSMAAASAAIKVASATAATATATAATVAAAPTAAAASAAASSAAAAAPVAVAYKPPGACADPGPFAYNAPEQKPLETSGAHSPAGNAASPPSVKQDSATMVPAKKP